MSFVNLSILTVRCLGLWGVTVEVRGSFSSCQVGLVALIEHKLYLMILTKGHGIIGYDHILPPKVVRLKPLSRGVHNLMVFSVIISIQSWILSCIQFLRWEVCGAQCCYRIGNRIELIPFRVMASLAPLLLLYYLTGIMVCKVITMVHESWFFVENWWLKSLKHSWCHSLWLFWVVNTASERSVNSPKLVMLELDAWKFQVIECLFLLDRL